MKRGDSIYCHDVDELCKWLKELDQTGYEATAWTDLRIILITKAPEEGESNDKTD